MREVEARMREPIVVAAVIVGVAVVVATSLWIYFSPYHYCVRAIAAKRAAPEKIFPGKPDFSAYGEPAEVETDEHRFGIAAQYCAMWLGSRG